MKNLLLLFFLLSSFFVRAQEVQNEQRNKEKDGVAIVASTGVFYPFNPELKAELGNTVFVPKLSFYFLKEFSFLLEYSRFSFRKAEDNQPVFYAQNNFNAGLSNQVALNKRLSFRHKYVFSVAIVESENFNIENGFHPGFTTGIGLQTVAEKGFMLYFDTNYTYLKNNLGGITLEPGVLYQF